MKYQNSVVFATDNKEQLDFANIIDWRFQEKIVEQEFGSVADPYRQGSDTNTFENEKKSFR